MPEKQFLCVLDVKIHSSSTVDLNLYLTLTNSMGQNHSLEANSRSADQKIFHRYVNQISWRKLHNDELHNLYSSPNIVRVIKSRSLRWAGHVARIGEGRSVYRVLVGRPEGKRPLGRPRRRWEDNIKMDLRKMGIDEANWIQLAQDWVQWRAFVSTVMNLRVS
jgi:hypothetical protein